MLIKKGVQNVNIFGFLHEFTIFYNTSLYFRYSYHHNRISLRDLVNIIEYIVQGLSQNDALLNSIQINVLNNLKFHNITQTDFEEINHLIN